MFSYGYDILKYFPVKYYIGIHALVDYSVCIYKYQHLPILNAKYYFHGRKMILQENIL
jgi:hypothetical protein